MSNALKKLNDQKNMEKLRDQLEGMGIDIGIEEIKDVDKKKIIIQALVELEAEIDELIKDPILIRMAYIKDKEKFRKLLGVRDDADYIFQMKANKRQCQSIRLETMGFKLPPNA